MTRLFGVISIGLVLLAVAGSGSKDTTAPEVLWTKTFGAPNAPELAKKVRQTSDGGYILVGGTTRPGSGHDTYHRKFSQRKREIPPLGASQPGSGHYVYLIKTDPSGNLQWKKTLGDGKNDWGFDVQQTSDGGYILAGETMKGGIGKHDLDVFVLRTDADGNELWKKVIGTPGDPYSDWARGVQQTSDGGFILAGMMTSTDENKDAFLIKLAKDR